MTNYQEGDQLKRRVVVVNANVPDRDTTKVNKVMEHLIRKGKLLNLSDLQGISGGNNSTIQLPF